MCILLDLLSNLGWRLGLHIIMIRHDAIGYIVDTPRYCNTRNLVLHHSIHVHGLPLDFGSNPFAYTMHINLFDDTNHPET
jgi:hypothetical protein